MQQQSKSQKSQKITKELKLNQNKNQKTKSPNLPTLYTQILVKYLSGVSRCDPCGRTDMLTEDLKRHRASVCTQFIIICPFVIRRLLNSLAGSAC